MTTSVNVMEGYASMPVTLYDDNLSRVMDAASRERKWVVAVITATKPDFYKQWSILPACDRAGIPSFIINTGQHFDGVLGRGLDEFGLRERFAADLAVRGDLLQKNVELTAKIGWLGKYLKKKWPGVTVVPVVHGDTMVAGIAPGGWMFATNQKMAQNEAGLRGMAPACMKKIGAAPMDLNYFIEEQWTGTWEIYKQEPFPEQWDTFVGANGSEFLFAPTELNCKHLVREGHSQDRVWVVGNSVVDAVQLKLKEKMERSIFDVYPKLEKNSDWIRVDIHRRENLTPKRFAAIMGGVTDLAEQGYNIIFIEMNATKMALEYYKMRDKLLELEKKDNFVMTGVWPEYYHVIEFLNSGRCFAELTDSGSMQEELNEIKKVACLTCRFSTDRPETVFQARTNVLVPPISREWVSEMTKFVYKNDGIRKTMTRDARIYGKNVGEKIAKVFTDLMNSGDRPFRWVHETMGLWKEEGNGPEYL